MCKPMGFDKERGTHFILLGVVLLAWSYLATRAALVPFIQDEANSFWMFVHAGEFLPFRSHTDAGNHFLSSFFGIVGYKLFGYSAIGIRWGSLAAFPFYAMGCWTITRSLMGLTRWCSFLALAFCPFLLDFFALFRGYGPAMAGWIWALCGFAGFVKYRSLSQLLLMVAAASAALFANLSLLPECGILFGVSLLVLTLDRQTSTNRLGKGAFLAFAAFGAVLSFALLIALDLRQKDLLYLGTSKGLMSGPVRTLIDAVFSGPRSLLTDQVIIAPLFIGLGLAAWQAVHKQWRSDLTIFSTLFLLSVLARVFMFHFMGTNYPYDRAAIQWIPLFILVYAETVDVLARHRRAWRWAALLLLAFPARTVATLNTDRLSDSYEKTFPLRFLDEVALLHGKLGRPILLSGSEHFAPCWAFHQAAGSGEIVEMRSNMDPHDPDDARVVTRERLGEYQAGYHVADSSRSGAVLLIRDRPLAWSLSSDTLLPAIRTNDEWIRLPVTCPSSPAGICVIFNAEVKCTDPTSDIMLVTEVVDGAGQYLRYDAAELRHWPQLTSGTLVEIARFMPAIPQGGKCGFYLWNKSRSSYQTPAVRIRTMGVHQ
ncbi:MAG: hypothetical protein JST38_05765 [Bacteroidetes bacterium]|nr:hypothetical protein [Bacteroidota bacterium]